MTVFELAHRYVGEIRELPGAQQHPLIQWWHSLCSLGMDQPDEVPWCSSFANGMAWELRLPRSKSAAARSWMGIGVAVELAQAEAAYDVVIFSRGTNPSAGHVGFFAGVVDASIRIIGGNQSNGVSIGTFPKTALLGVRRLR